MLRSGKAFLARNRRLIVLVFEIFWIAVFLIEKVGGGALEIPQFVYVNF